MLNNGDVLGGRYSVMRQLGSGRIGLVYEVYDQRLHNRYAIQEVSRGNLNEQRRLLREAQLLAHLNHPNLPRVIDFFNERDTSFLVMELIPNDHLGMILQYQGQPFPVDAVFQWADQLLDALEFLHSQPVPVTHGNIKPSNLKIDNTGRIKLLGLGSKKQQYSVSTEVDTVLPLDLHFTAPEQFSTTMLVDRRSDIYSLAATLYFLLTGQVPTSALNRTDGHPLSEPHALHCQCSPLLTSTILRAMSLYPDERFQSIQEFRTSLKLSQSKHTTCHSAKEQRLKVFLCHSSDDKPIVRQLYQQLHAAGFNSWLDEENLLPGQDWHREITRAVRESDVVIICLSNKSVTKAGYIQREMRFALDVAEEKPEGTIFLIPAKLEECTIPDRLSNIQWVNLFEKSGYDRLLRTLQLRANELA